MTLRTHMSPCALEWAEAMREAGFTDGTRRNVIARVLDKNEFLNMRQLKHVQHPSEWLGFDRLRAEEVDWLGSFILERAASEHGQDSPSVVATVVPASCSDLDRVPAVRVSEWSPCVMLVIRASGQTAAR